MQKKKKKKKKEQKGEKEGRILFILSTTDTLISLWRTNRSRPSSRSGGSPFFVPRPLPFSLPKPTKKTVKIGNNNNKAKKTLCF
jgi:hypothetical protein